MKQMQIIQKIACSLTGAMVIAAAGASGCSAFDRIGGGSRTNPRLNNFVDVIIDNPAASEEVSVRVTSSNGNKPLFEAVKHMQNDDFADAITQLEAGVEDKQIDAREHFALAVCYEVMGRYADALKQYKKANTLDTQTDYTSGRKRVEAKLDANPS